MWLDSLKRGVCGLLLIGGFAAGAAAAPVTVTLEGGNNGTLVEGTDTKEFTVSGDITLDVSIAQTPPITGFTLSTCADGDPADCTTLSLVDTATEGENAYVLRYSFLSSQTYLFTISGTPVGLSGSDYNVKFSAVPLPAAAWMFLSMLFGGAWIKRRSASSKGGFVATA